MNLDKLLPKSSIKTKSSKLDDIMYIILIVWRWDYETFLRTPIPIIMRMLNKHVEIKTAESRARKKKK